MKSNALRTLAAGTVAVAALTFAAPAAHAQQWSVGVQLGAPQYGVAYAPAPRYGYGYDRYDWRERERHEAWERHEAIEARQRAYNQQRFREHEAREHGYRGW